MYTLDASLFSSDPFTIGLYFESLCGQSFVVRSSDRGTNTVWLEGVEIYGLVNFAGVLNINFQHWTQS